MSAVSKSRRTASSMMAPPRPSRPSLAPSGSSNLQGHTSSSRRLSVVKSYPELKKECDEMTKEVQRLKDQLKVAKDGKSRAVHRATEAEGTLTSTLKGKEAEISDLSSELSRIKLELKDTKLAAAEMVEEAQKKCAAESESARSEADEAISQANGQVGSLTEKLEAAQRRLEALGVDAVSLQRWQKAQTDKENERTMHIEALKEGTVELEEVEQEAATMLTDIKGINGFLQEMADWFSQGSSESFPGQGEEQKVELDEQHPDSIVNAEETQMEGEDGPEVHEDPNNQEISQREMESENEQLPSQPLPSTASPALSSLPVQQQAAVHPTVAALAGISSPSSGSKFQSPVRKGSPANASPAPCTPQQPGSAQKPVLQQTLTPNSRSGTVVVASEARGVAASPLAMVLAADGALDSDSPLVPAHAQGSDWVSAENWASELPDEVEDF